MQYDTRALVVRSKARILVYNTKDKLYLVLGGYDLHHRVLSVRRSSVMYKIGSAEFHKHEGLVN